MRPTLIICAIVACLLAFGCSSPPDQQQEPIASTTQALTCDDGNPCTTDTGVYPLCTHTSVTNGTPCNDNNACTRTDTCQRGICTGSNPVVCTALDQCHLVGTCNTTTGICTNPIKTNGTTCNDNNGCTQTDTCQSGTCTGSNPVVCTASDQCHLAGTCTPATGMCTNPPKNNGTSCSDGNACTLNDTCQGGACNSGSPVVCTASDQCHLAGVCDTGTGVCSNPPKTNGTTCNDANLCTQTDTCQSGVCTGSNPVVCTASDQCHDVGTCNTSTGVCSNPPKADYTSCNDGNACTQRDMCMSGSCQGSDPVICYARDDCHNAGVCNTSTGICTDPEKPNGTTCNDGSACTQTDTCQAGNCTGSNPIVCTALDECHDVGTCNPANGTCSNPNKANGAACDDRSDCTRSDSCQNGSCIGSDPVVCTASDQCHDVGTCNPADGTCSNPNKANGTGCNDNNLCTQTDTCQNGTCTGSNPVVCTASDQCHNVGTCDTGTGICSNPPKTNGTTCSDGSACTQTDTCQNGTCVGGNPVQCPAIDQCHQVGSCNPSDGTCINPWQLNGTPCSDSNACTQSDSCQNGTCVGTNPVVCPTPDQCHDPGTCNTSTGVCSNPSKTDGTPCGDGNACTQTDTCQGGTCTGSNPVVCPTPDQCHDAGTCNTSTGVCSNPVKTYGSPCNDNNACTSSDHCDNGSCVGSNQICFALDQCHNSGTCDPGTGICSNPVKADGSLCNDDNACTQTDTCQSGSCTGTNPVVCSALGQCYNVGTCDTGTGVCSNPPKSSGTACTDSNACTNGDQCNGSGTCVPGAPLSCDDTNVCTIDDCNTSTGCTHAAASSATPCSDNTVCTTSDHCNGAGTCIGTAISCDDSNICTVDGCDAVQGCTHSGASTSVSCNDNNACTSPDHCNGSGTCTGDAFSFDDQNACTTDTCDPGTGVSHTPKPFGTPCPDNTSSNGDELCNASQTCIQGTSSVPVLTRVGGPDANVKERRLGAGRHPVASGSQGMAVAFVELLMDDGAAPRVGVATFSLLGEGRGVGRIADVNLEADPVIAALPDGSFALAYTKMGLDGDGLGIALVRVSSTGTILSPTKVANQTTEYGQRAADILWTGTELVVGWEDESQVDGRRICTRRFSSALAALENEVCVAVPSVFSSRLALGAAGGQLVRAWRKDGLTASSIEVRFGSGAPSFPLTELPPGELPALVALDSTHVLVVYTEGLGTEKAVVLSNAGATVYSGVLSPTGVERYNPSMVSTTDGIYLAWREPAVLGTNGWNANLDELYFQKLTWNGTTLTAGDALTLPADAPHLLGDQNLPAMAPVSVSPSGAILAAWDDLRANVQGQSPHGDVLMSLMVTPVVR
ncbi:MAG: hypothetical protein HY898_21295 [Deltaproteobacteria bacterium]|nr:hypothetical protein [Deltaproteobacteria bacterium]